MTSRRGLSTVVAAIIMAVVVVVGGVGAYAALSSVPTSTVSKSSCSPASACVTSNSTNDVKLFIPYTVGFGQTYSQTAVGNTVQATVSVTGGETIKSYNLTWGPSNTTSGATGSLTYQYASTGLYTLAATATTPSGILHTGTKQLGELQVNPDASQVSSGHYPTVATTLTNTTGGPYTWIAPGGTITVNGSYSHGPANPLWSASPPTLTGPSGITSSGASSGATYATATYSFPSPGYYGITMVVQSSDGATTAYLNYTWGIYVGAPGLPLGCAVCNVPTESDPHPGLFVNYEVVPGGALTLDPAADYYSVGYEVGQGFDESLIGNNGTDSGQTYSNFFPEVATCVPGSPQCVSQWGTSLVSGNNFTFVIDPAAHFYDPGTKASRQVYPTDVEFSIIRAIFGTQVVGATGYYVGFDIAGPLVPYYGLVCNGQPTCNEVNSSWDAGVGGAALHFPYNNTPSYVYASMSINDTQWCPAAAMHEADGCITFHADAGGKSWPALLQILSIISADGIQAAGWYTAQGAGVPGFVCTGADDPCNLPGDVNTTNSSAFTSAVGLMSPTAFDAAMTLFATGYPDPYPSVGFNEVGSGPYYLAYANQGVGYVLEANPAYQAPSGCAGESWCLPLPGQYVQKVITYWEPDDTVGISELQAGYADTAAFEAGDFGTMLGMIGNGQLGLLNFPTLSTSEFSFNTEVDFSLLSQFWTGTPDFLANVTSFVGLRAVLTASYPYTTEQTILNLIDGIDEGSAWGGFLPPAETAFYNASTPYPNYNPATTTFGNPTVGNPTEVGTASWYWAQATTPGTSLYDYQLSGYSPSHPLVLPVLGFTSAPVFGTAELAWNQTLVDVTGGAVQFAYYDVASSSEVYTYIAPGQVPWVIWWNGWIPDYPAPVNNWEGAYGTGLWGAADALAQTFAGAYTGGNFNDTAVCGPYYGPTLQNLSYWASQPGNVIPQVCQGMAWNVTTYFVNQATYTLDTALATQEWGLIQTIYGALELSIGITATNTVFDYAPWVNPATINTNVLIGGGSEWYYSALSGNGMY
ncbi:MAG TPA: hypothetical protein VMG99_06535 [Thermoplasmata archaeon]|nr:hypothetical protein [Thermoplasmata archaeon]